MKPEGFVLGASAGLLLALLFIAGASAFGSSALHIDLIHGISSVSSGMATAAPPAGEGAQTNSATSPSSPPPSFSSVSGLSTDGGRSLAALLVPILLAALVGTAFYGLSARRVDAE
ncbi:MAG: hypothetical protein JRN09_04685 [Nitrososphaerota archaeon]|jgi:hypothetical protein|nr:hypothetical protein [Nitrososphaerota archaeon]